MEKYYISSNKYSLRERVTKLNGKVYDVIFYVTTIDGETKQKWLRGYKNKTLAKEGYIEYIQEYCELIRRGTLSKKDKTKEILYIGDLVKQYFSTLGNQNKFSSIYDKNNIFRMYILPRYEKEPIDKLTREELALWQDDIWSTKNPRTGKYFSHKYLVKIRTIFNAFLSWVETRYGIKNNLVFVPKPKIRQSKKEMLFWTRDQFEIFIKTVKDDPTYHALFTFMFYTGRRKGELLALTPADVTMESIKINKSLTRKTPDSSTYAITTTKADKSQILPICDIVQKEIIQYAQKKSAKFYFGGDKPLSDSAVRRKFLEYTKKADLPQIRVHDLRHSFVSMLIHLGGNFMVVSDLIGDTVEQVTKTYGHMYQEDKFSIISRIK